MKRERTKTAEIILRMTPEQKALVERAAQADGRSVNSWGVWELCRAARAALGESQYRPRPGEMVETS